MEVTITGIADLAPYGMHGAYSMLFYAVNSKDEFRDLHDALPPNCRLFRPDVMVLEQMLENRPGWIKSSKDRQRAGNRIQKKEIPQFLADFNAARTYSVNGRSHGFCNLTRYYMDRLILLRQPQLSTELNPHEGAPQEEADGLTVTLYGLEWNVQVRRFAPSIWSIELYLRCSLLTEDIAHKLLNLPHGLIGEHSDGVLYYGQSWQLPNPASLERLVTVCWDKYKATDVFRTDDLATFRRHLVEGLNSIDIPAE